MVDIYKQIKYWNYSQYIDRNRLNRSNYRIKKITTMHTFISSQILKRDLVMLILNCIRRCRVHFQKLQTVYYIGRSAILFARFAKTILMFLTNKHKYQFYQNFAKSQTFSHWLYVIIMSRTRFRMNLHFIVTWWSRSSLLKTGVIYEV